MKLRRFKLPRSLVHHSLPTNQGFTVLELLIIIAISSILVAIAFPSFLNIVDETKINLLAEQVRQSLKEAQQQAISEGYSYSVTFRKTPQGLQVNHSPINVELESQRFMSSEGSPPAPLIDSEPQNWQELSTSIPPDRLIFIIPDSFTNRITFMPEGNADYPTRVFLAIGDSGQPRVNTRRCINIINSEAGGSYFQIDKDLACDLSPNPSGFMEPVR